METELKDLTTILEKEAEIHDKLIETATAIHQNIKDNDITALQQHNSVYDDTIFLLEKAEEKRVECCTKITGTLGMPESVQTKVTVFIDRIPGEYKVKIVAARDTLKQKIQELTKVNTCNRILLEEAMAAIDNTFSSVKQAKTRMTGYGQRGAKAYSTDACTFFNRTI